MALNFAYSASETAAVTSSPVEVTILLLLLSKMRRRSDLSLSSILFLSMAT